MSDIGDAGEAVGAGAQGRAIGSVPAELLRGLGHLAEPPGLAHEPLAAALELPSPPDRAGYEALFGFQLYPWASVYLGPEGMLGGDALRRVEGFWRAVGREVPRDPDHLASLLGLYAALADEEADLRARRLERARAELIARSRSALLEEYLAPWVFAFLERVGELGGPFHVAWSKLLTATLEGEIAKAGPLHRVPVSLEEIPTLADPRSAGADPFLSGLLAPAVSGMIVTRADLARVASACELGLRAGERRYALKHLLGQDASAVLIGLADEADRQAAAHCARAVRLGSGTGWTADRAERSALLLRTLADSADDPVVATPSPQDP